jgi:hypothetical protein
LADLLIGLTMQLFIDGRCAGTLSYHAIFARTSDVLLDVRMFTAAPLYGLKQRLQLIGHGN